MYAGGPQISSAQGSAGKTSGSVRDEVAIAGLERAHVDQFEAIGFERNKVVRSTPILWGFHLLHDALCAD